MADLIVTLIGVGLIPFAEWVIHRHLFHSPSASMRARRFGMGRAHHRHHEDPTDPDWVMLPTGGAVMILVGVATAVVPLAALVAVAADAAFVGPWLTATVLGWLAVLHYEWTHLLIHSGVRPRTRYYRKRARNHRLHHYRNEGYWFGVTTDLGDRFIRTLPEPPGSVPRSPTARTLEP